MEPTTAPTLDHACPEPGCLIFPYDRPEDLAEHVAAGAHVYAADLVTRRAPEGFGIDLPVADHADEDDDDDRPRRKAERAAAEPVERVGRWVKTDAGWGARMPVESDPKAGRQGHAGELGELVEIRAGWAIFTLADRDEATGYRWIKAGDEWLVEGPAAEVGAVVTVTKRNGETADVVITTNLGQNADGIGLHKVERHEPAQVAPGSTPAPTDAPTITPEPGRVYVNAEGRFVRIRKSRGAGRLYGKIWDGAGWEYAPNATRDLVRTPTAEEAAAWGHEHGSCMFCSRSLEDDAEGRSVQVGYGPKCAKKYGLPWG